MLTTFCWPAYVARLCALCSSLSTTCLTSLVYHPAPGINAVTDLKQRTFAVNIGFAYWEWLKRKYGLQGAKEIPVSGDLGLFRNDPNMVQQGYSIFLPARMTAAGIPNAQFKVADLGYRPYDVLFTTDDMIQKNPELVRTTIAAVKASWSNFINDPRQHPSRSS